MQTATYHPVIERHEIDGFPLWRFVPEQGTTAPHVIVLHGLNSRKERHLHLCLELAQSGFCAVALDARSHGERTDAQTSDLHTDMSGFTFLMTFANVVEGTIGDVESVANTFGLTEYGLWGHSMGGYIAMRCALDDARVSVTVNLSGTLDIAGWGLPPIEPLADALRRADIIARAPELSPRALLLLHGALDELVPVSGARRLYTALRDVYQAEGASDRLQFREYPELGHDYTDIMRDESVAFFQKFLKVRNHDA